MANQLPDQLLQTAQPLQPAFVAACHQMEGVAAAVEAVPGELIVLLGVRAGAAAVAVAAHALVAVAKLVVMAVVLEGSVGWQGVGKWLLQTEHWQLQLHAGLDVRTTKRPTQRQLHRALVQSLDQC